MGDLELAVRAIENLLPDMPTKAIQKWLAILNTAAIKCEAELNSTLMHSCTACNFEEYGYRTELPIGWRSKGNVVICYNHDEKVANMWLTKKPVTIEKSIEVDKTLEELMSLI